MIGPAMFAAQALERKFIPHARSAHAGAQAEANFTLSAAVPVTSNL